MNMTTTEKPYCTLEMRQKLKLDLGKTDPVSRLLFDAIYTSRSVDEFEDKVSKSISQLLKALRPVPIDPSLEAGTDVPADPEAEI